jgi:hypothetical protein
VTLYVGLTLRVEHSLLPHLDIGLADAGVGHPQQDFSGDR